MDWQEIREKFVLLSVDEQRRFIDYLICLQETQDSAQLHPSDH